MLGKAYIELENTYVLLDKHEFYEQDGLIYNFTKNLMNFSHLPMERVYEIFRHFSNKLFRGVFYKGKSINIEEEEWSKEIEKMASYSPYFYFYCYALGRFLRSYVHNKPDAYFILSSCLTDVSDRAVDMGRGVQKYCDFYCDKEYQATSEVEIWEGLEIAVQMVVFDVFAKQFRLMEEFEFWGEHHENLIEISPDQRLFFLDYLREEKGRYYTGLPFHTTFSCNSPTCERQDDCETMMRYMKEEKVVVREMSDMYTLDYLIRYELTRVILGDYCVKKCECCGFFFIPRGRKDTKYCDRVMEGEKYPCKKIGASRKSEDKTKQDYLLDLYRKIYKRYHGKAMKGKMEQVDFWKWSDESSAKKAEYLGGTLVAEEFEKYLAEC
ncbi:MAG: DUF6076 domain-containing protein [Eubacteriales bacterium]